MRGSENELLQGTARRAGKGKKGNAPEFQLKIEHFGCKPQASVSLKFACSCITATAVTRSWRLCSQHVRPAVAELLKTKHPTGPAQDLTAAFGS